MKKVILGLVLVLILMVGCSGTLTGEVAPSIRVRGSSGVASSTFSVDNSITTIEGASVNEVSYEIYNNIGGGGVLDVGVIAFGGDCSTVTSTVSIPVTAATNTAAPIVSSGLLTLMQTYYAVSQHRVCLTYTQNVNVPLNLDIRIIVKASKSYSYSTGL